MASLAGFGSDAKTVIVIADVALLILILVQALQGSHGFVTLQQGIDNPELLSNLEEINLNIFEIAYNDLNYLAFDGITPFFSGEEKPEIAAFELNNLTVSPEQCAQDILVLTPEQNQTCQLALRGAIYLPADDLMACLTRVQAPRQLTPKEIIECEAYKNATIVADCAWYDAPCHVGRTLGAIGGVFEPIVSAFGEVINYLTAFFQVFMSIIGIIRFALGAVFVLVNAYYFAIFANELKNVVNPD